MYLIFFLLVLINSGNCLTNLAKKLPTDDSFIPKNHTTVFVKKYFETVEIQPFTNYSSQITLLNKNISSRTLPCIQISNIRAINLNGNLPFKNAANGVEIFVLNGTEISKWKNLIFLTPSFNIVVPPNAQINFTVSDKCETPYFIHSHYKGLICSPKNPGISAVMNEISIKTYYISTAKFTVKKFHGVDALILHGNGFRQQMNNGSIITQNGTHFHIFYASSNAQIDEFLIEYEINSGITFKCMRFIFFWIILVCAFGFYC